MIDIIDGKWKVMGGFNPRIAPLNFSSELAPDVLTPRITYTVPAGHKLYIPLVQLSARRETAASVSGAFIIGAGITKPDGTEHVICTLRGNNNDITSGALIAEARDIFLSAGDVFTASTLDFSTGGTIANNINATGVLIAYK